MKGTGNSFLVFFRKYSHNSLLRSDFKLFTSFFIYLLLGRWTVQEAAEQSVAAPTIAASLDQRYISARKDERVKAATILKGPTKVPSVNKEQVSHSFYLGIYVVSF